MKKYIYLIILLFISGYINAQSSEILFEKGNQAYKNKQYEIALKNYFQINNKKDISADLYYNIGNTYFRLNDYANAILYYERAHKLKPYDEAIDFNIKVANSKIVDKIAGDYEADRKIIEKDVKAIIADLIKNKCIELKK
jgi:tetratricopeptide (TPR) repeat protein